MKRDESVYLRHILDAIAKIESYLQDIDETTFSKQSLIQDGVIRQLEIVAKQSSEYQANSALSNLISRGKISPVCATSSSTTILESIWKKFG